VGLGKDFQKKKRTSRSNCFNSKTVNNFGKSKYDASFVDIKQEKGYFLPDSVLLKDGLKPQKRICTSKMVFFQGGSNGKVVVPGVMVISPVDKNLGSKILPLGSKYQNFLGQNCPFSRSMFST